jgi:hypothetical protein
MTTSQGRERIMSFIPERDGSAVRIVLMNEFGVASDTQDLNIAGWLETQTGVSAMVLDTSGRVVRLDDFLAALRAERQPRAVDVIGLVR